MATLTHKTLLYDGACPMCTAYSNNFVKLGTLTPQGRLSLMEAENTLLAKVDLNRARHEIPLVDSKTGEVLYGVDALGMVIANTCPILKPAASSAWIRNLFRPVYSFISYNRRIIAGTGNSACGNDFAPDFHLGWRILLIVLGISYTGGCIYLFSTIAKVQNVVMLFACVFSYFLLLLVSSLLTKHTLQQRWNYIGNLSVLAVMEGSTFVATAWIARELNMPGLLFAGQGAGRLLFLWMHDKRVRNNGFNPRLNIAFAFGALMLIIYLAYIIK